MAVIKPSALRRSAFPPLCLVCGVDSGPIKVFLFAFIGSLFLAAILLFVWAWGTKRLGTDEKMASLAIEAEKEKK